MNIIKIFIYSLLTGVNLITYSVFAESSVWKVSKGVNYFYIGGTIHLLTKEDHPLPNEFGKAYKDTSEIILETDLIATKTAEFQSKFMTAIMYGDGRTLQTQIEAKTYKKLENFMMSRGLSISSFSKFRPWGVSLMITILEYQRLNMMPEYGVDEYFNNLALIDNKKLSSLETPEEQLNLLTSMAALDPNVAIEYTLNDLKYLPDFIKLMKTSWRSGDIEAFTTNPLVVQMRTEFPEMYKTIVTNRNNAWMEYLLSLINDKDTEFVLVGAMHLNGKEGLLNQLKKQGFKVKKL